MSNQSKVWCHSLKTGSILKLAKTYYLQDRFIETLALCIKAAYVECPASKKLDYRPLLIYASTFLREVLEDVQYRRILYATSDIHISKEFLIMMLNQLNQFQQHPELITTLYGSNYLNIWNSSIIASLPNPTPELLEISQSFLQLVHQKLLVNLPPEQPSHLDVLYSEYFSHLSLPPGYMYSIDSLSTLFTAFEEDQREEEESLTEENYYAFYRYLKALGQHTGSAYTIACDYKNQVIASGGADNCIKLWSPETKQELYSLLGHEDAVLSVAFSPNGQILASGSADKTIKLWNLETRQILHTLVSHEDAVLSVAFSPNGQILASGSADKTIKLWNLETRQILHTLVGHEDAVLSVAFSPNGQILASGSADKTIKLWNLETRQIYNCLQGFDCVYSLSFSSINKSMITAHRDHSIRVWNSDTYELNKIISTYADIVSIAVSPDGQAIAGGGGFFSDRVIWLWNFNTGEVINTFRIRDVQTELQHLIYAISFSSDGSTIASAGRDGMIHLWGIPKALS